MKTVASRDNAAYKAMARLVASGAERRRGGVSILDGAHLLGAFLDSGRKPEEVMVNRAGLENAEIAALVDRSQPARVTLLADAPLVLLLEEIQDPGNVGTLLRSAAAAGAGHVLLSPRCAFAWSPKVMRAAMGAHFAVNIVEGADLDEFLARYRGTSVALDARAEGSLYDLDLTKPAAFLIGNEGAGLSDALLGAAQVRARIPMPGSIESLNAATAGSICLFEAVRQRSIRAKSGGHR